MRRGNMGVYLNPGNEKFAKAVQSEIYVDKTGLIEYTNQVINTVQRYVCVSRPRRFGKSMTADMLTAYYGKECDSRELFSGLKISQNAVFGQHLNQYPTIFLNMQEFLSRSKEIGQVIDRVRRMLLRELKNSYPDVDYFDDTDLVESLQDIYAATKQSFVIIIDEWDCVFREYQQDKKAQEEYLDFLRDFLKDKVYVALAYLTGILPIKKYGTHSALNMFDEFTMLDPGPLAEYVGFTEQEVEELCGRYQMDLAEIKNWYDGYSFPGESSVYSPRSVVNAMRFRKIGNYWNQTETFEALQWYIDLNFDGLRDDVLQMMAGKKIPVNTGSFTNDMTTFRTEDDVLTLLIHLGYLGYEEQNKYVFIPNAEVQSEYASAVTVSQWGDISKALKNSADLLQAVWEKQETQVAEGIRLAHFETSQLQYNDENALSYTISLALYAATLNAIWQRRPAQVAEGIRQAHFETSHIQYNDENALSYTISLALYAARNFYTVHREMAGGKGFADLVFVPRKRYQDKPALVVELKWDKTAEGALAQIKDKEYCRSLEEYQGNLLLVGINYNKKTKEHVCRIEEYQK